MPAEQLPLLGLDAEVPTRPSTRPRVRRPSLARQLAPEATIALAPGEVAVEHHYPEAHAFLSEHGADALAVLHVLAVRAEIIDEAGAVDNLLGFDTKVFDHDLLNPLANLTHRLTSCLFH